MLDIENSIVVIIDIQEKLVKAVRENSPLSSAVKLAKASNILNIPVIVTEQYPQGLGETVGELKNELAPETAFIEKNTFSAFRTPEFAEKLKKSNRKQVVICGIEAHICVYQTICDLITNGYEVYFVKDASASRNEYEFNTALELIKQNKGKVACTEIILFEWLKSSRHPNFKEIQTLIK